MDLEIGVATKEIAETLVKSKYLTKDELNRFLTELGVSPITEISQRPTLDGGGNALPIVYVVIMIVAVVIIMHLTKLVLVPNLPPKFYLSLCTFAFARGY